jgi:hypothetical protein
MDLPGDYSLAARDITTAITSEAQTGITDLDGMQAVTLEAVFAGSGGTSCQAIVRTRIGPGGNWREIARFDFTVAGAKSANIVANASAGVAALAALNSDSVLQGFLGTELDCVVSSVGTWVDGVLAVRAAAR